jgi:hypothetical protein
VLHDLPTGARRNREGFLDSAAELGVRLRQDFAPECVPILDGRIVRPLADIVYEYGLIGVQIEPRPLVGYDLAPELGKRRHAQSENDCLARGNGGKKFCRPCQRGPRRYPILPFNGVRA